jgi:DNA-binding NarL/FixJ family response regulator
MEVLRLIADGATNAEIGAALHLTLSTVKSHVAHVLRKTGVEHRAGAAAFAHRRGLA